MSLNNYRTFIRIVESGSLAATARELHISPSAVSKQLAGLEQRLGVRLLQRSTRSVQVTEAGERFFRSCVGVVRAAEAAESEVRDLVGDPGGELRITMAQAIASEDFTQLLSAFTRSYPSITLDISVSNTELNLIENNYEVAFHAGHLRDSRMLATELFRAKIVMCAAPDYIAQFGVPSKLEDLADHTLLVPSRHYLQNQMRSVESSTLSSAYEKHLQCDDLGMLVELAQLGAGIAIMWESYIQGAVAQGRLVQFDSLIELAPRPVNMIHLTRDYLPRRLSLFLDHVKHHYKHP